MKNIKELKKELNTIYSDYRAEKHDLFLFFDLRSFIKKYDLDVEELDNFVNEDTATNIIKYLINSHSWEFLELITFLRDIKPDELYIYENGFFRNVRTEDFRDLKDSIIEALENKYITKVKNLIANEVEKESLKMLTLNKTIKKEDAFNKIVNYIINIIDNEKCVTETDIKKWVAEELENIYWDNTAAVIKQINELCNK